MKKILVDNAYKKVFLDWVKTNILGLQVELASNHQPLKGLFLLSGDGSTSVLADGLIARATPLFRRHSKDYEKTIKSAEAWVLWTNCQIILNPL